MVDRSTITRWVNYWHCQIGANVVPISFKAKVPLKGFAWTEWQEKPQPKEFVDRLVADGSFDGGLAIITGRLWRGQNEGKFIAGIDLDNAKAVEVLAPHFGCKTLEELAQKTVVVMHKDKPNKGHVMVVCESPLPKREADSNLPDDKPKIEVKGWSDQLIHCPHSIHVDGQPYEVIGTFTPMVLDTAKTQELIQKIEATCKEFGLQYLEKLGKKKEANWDSIKEGNRDEQAFSNALALLKQGLSADMVLASLIEWDKKNEPPLGERTLKAKVESALKYQPQNQPPKEEANAKKDKTPEWKKLYNKYSQIYNIISRTDTKQVFMFNPEEGVYVDADPILRKDLRRDDAGLKMINEVINAFVDLNYVHPNLFDAEEDRIHLQNGWLNIKTYEFEPHSPLYYSFTKLAPYYDASAKCPKILEFLDAVLQQEDVEVMQKIFGYLLLPGNKYKKAFWFIGDKDTGKSTFIELMELFIGQASHISLHDLEQGDENRKVVTGAHTLLNTTSEIGSKKIKDDTMFKRWTGNDTITVRHLYQEPFNVKFLGKFVVASNDMPNFVEMDRAFMERWLLIPFLNVISDDEKDRDILKKMTTREELSGLLNWAIEGLKKLEKDCYFRKETWEEIQKKWKEMGSTVDAFLGQKTEKGEKFEILTTSLFEAYCNYCEEKKQMPLNDVNFGKELKKRMIAKSERRLGKTVKRVYTGIRLIQEDNTVATEASIFTKPERELVVATEVKKVITEYGGEIDIDLLKTLASPASLATTPEEVHSIIDDMITKGTLVQGSGKDMVMFKKK